MNPALHHLASLQCWQRSQSAAVKPAAFIILQTLAAEEPMADVYPSTLVTKTRLPLASVYTLLHKLEEQDLVAFSPYRSGSKTGRPAFRIRLTLAGLNLMTPVAILPATPPPSNPWSQSQL